MSPLLHKSYSILRQVKKKPVLFLHENKSQVNVTLGHIFKCGFRGNGWMWSKWFVSLEGVWELHSLEESLLFIFHVQAACSFHKFVFWWGARIIERSLVSLVTWFENDQIIYRAGCWECLIPIPIDIEFHLYNFTLYEFVLTLNIDVS